MRLVQLQHLDGRRAVAIVDEPALRCLRSVPAAYDLARRAIAAGQSLDDAAAADADGDCLEYDAVYSGNSDWKLLACLDRDGLVSTSALRSMWYPEDRPVNSSWRMGFDGPSASGSSGGALISESAVCHLGFTGCSVWLNPPIGASGSRMRCVVVVITPKIQRKVKRRRLVAVKIVIFIVKVQGQSREKTKSR